MFDIQIIEKQLMGLIESIAASKQLSRMLLDNDVKGQSLAAYVDTQVGKETIELHLKYVTAMNAAIAFASELLKKIDKMKPAPEAIPEAAPAEAVADTVQ